VKQITSDIQRGLVKSHLHRVLVEGITAESSSSKVSHRVFMQHANETNSQDLSTTSFTTYFVTDYAEKYFLQSLEKAEWSGLKEVLRIMDSHPGAHVMQGKIFEPLVHMVLCHSEEPVHLVSMQFTQPDNRSTTFKVDNSSVSFSYLFQRTQMTQFSTTAPSRIQSDHYYQGTNSTPLIDAFVIQHAGRETTLYFIQITVAHRKISDAQSGPKLVEAIIKTTEHCLKRKVKVRFVLIEPGFGIRAITGPTTSWKFAVWPVEGQREFDVYVGTVVLPNAPPKAA
jgi:hypothetical protein